MAPAATFENDARSIGESPRQERTRSSDVIVPAIARVDALSDAPAFFGPVEICVCASRKDCGITCKVGCAEIADESVGIQDMKRRSLARAAFESSGLVDFVEPGTSASFHGQNVQTRDNVERANADAPVGRFLTQDYLPAQNSANIYSQSLRLAGYHFGQLLQFYDCASFQRIKGRVKHTRPFTIVGMIPITGTASESTAHFDWRSKETERRVAAVSEAPADGSMSRSYRRRSANSRRSSELRSRC